jgi:glycosyltransferase involved in cell wall biosynthesis
MNKKDQPLVSVIMNCFNGEKYLREAIDSVYAQTYDNWEIIFWDNASTDNSAEIAKSYDSKLSYFKSEKTVTLGAARNKALKQAKGEFIAFLDSDDLWLPDKLQLQIPLFSKDRIGIVISNVIYFSSNNREKILYRFRKPPTGNVFEKLLENYYIAMPTVIIRIESLLSLDHWFDPEFNLIEDFDLLTRISYKWELGYVDTVQAKYRIHDKSFTSIQRENFSVEINAMLDKYNKAIPEFANRYNKQIYSLNRIIDWLDAQVLATSGSFREASKKIKKYSFDSIKWFAKFLLISLPFIRKLFVKKLLNRI